MISGSSLHRVLECPGSALLPVFHDEGLEQRLGPARDRGVAIHRFLEMVREAGREEALAAVEDEDTRNLCAAIDVEDLPTEMATEVALAWNYLTKTGRELGRNLGHRNYHLLPHPPTQDEIPMTLDVVGIGHSWVFVTDYKTGYARLPRPAAYAQTMLGAVAAASVYGGQDAVVQIIYIRSDGTHYKVTDEVDDWDLEMFADKVRDVIGSLKILVESKVESDAERMLAEGPHCDFCPSFRGCPRKLSLVKAMPETLSELGIDDALQFDAKAITMAKAAGAYLAVEKLEELLKRVKSEVMSLAWHVPIDLGDGRVIEPHETVRRAVKADVAWDILTRRYGEDARQAFELDTSFQAIQRLVVAKKESGQKITTKKGTGAMDVVVAEIDAAGGVVEKRTQTCSPHRPKK